ncbi:MAG: M20/M25/M40 family metallo-hydrolase [Cyclobacteriaceae bacterium]
MNKLTPHLLLAALLAVVLISVYNTQPPDVVQADAPDSVFSAQRAMNDLQAITRSPHPTGSAENKHVREYIIAACQEIGLETTVQETMGYYFRSPRVVGGRIVNVLATLRGTDPSRAVVIMSHYDSEPNAGGAGDDGAGVAAMLETARILARGKKPLNDIVFLFTDGEEQGLLGASAFVEQHPVGKNVGVVLNFEGRGNAGISTMFEVNPGNGWVIREFAKAVNVADANALSYEIYRSLPNDTDYSPFKKAGIVGLNHAFIDGFVYYHSYADKAPKMDLRSMQHHGEYMLSEAKHFGNIRFGAAAEGDVTYFTLPVVGMIIYPAGLNMFWTGLCIAGLLLLLIAGHRKQKLSLSGVLATALIFLASLIVAVLALTGVTWLIGKMYPEMTNFYASSGYHPEYFFLVMTGVASIVWILALYLMRKKWRLMTIMAGTHLILALLLVLAQVYTPTAVYVLCFPILIQLIILLLQCTEKLVGMKSEVVAALASVPGILLFAPMIYFLFIAFGLEMPAPFAAITIIIGWAWLTPTLDNAIADTPYRYLAAVAGICVIAWVVGHLHAGYSAEEPLQSSLWYEYDASTRKAHWKSAQRMPDHWNQQFLSNAERRKEGFWSLLTKETQVVDTLSSVVTIQSDSVADGSRTLVLFVKPAPGTLSAQIEMDSARAIHVDTVPIQSDEPFTLLTLSGDWSNGYQVRLNCATGRPFHLSITDRRPGLPEAAGFKGYPEDVIPGTGRRNHTTAVKKSFAF